MAQWNKNTQDFLNQERSLFEVNMLANKNGEIVSETNRFPVGIGSTGLVSLKYNNKPISSFNQIPVNISDGFIGDLFGRLKVSNPYTLFDSTHRYSQDGDFDDVILGVGSTVGIITSQSTATLTIGSTSGCSYIRESKRVFAYQPGKSIQVFQTFVLNPAKTNLVQIVGYGSSQNGVFLKQEDFDISFIKRTAISGVSTTVSIPQSQWNTDTLDGEGPSGYILDLSKVQILFTEYEWLGAGSVRIGFAIDGKFITAHQFNHANEIDSVYITTASLPVRYELYNKGNVGTSSTIKQICVSVQSNGGYEKKVNKDVARRLTLTSGISSSTNFTPIVSMRLSPGRDDAVVLPSSFSFLGDSSGTGSVIEIALIKNGTISATNWTSTSSPNVQQNIDAVGIVTGGTIVYNDYTSAANKLSNSINVESEYNWDLQLGRTQSKVSDVYTLAARVVDGSSSNFIGSLHFYDLT